MAQGLCGLAVRLVWLHLTEVFFLRCGRAGKVPSALKNDVLCCHMKYLNFP